MVKKHSSLLGKTAVDADDASDVEMDPRFWHDVLDMYFVRGKDSRGRQDDDLVFFVRKKLVLQFSISMFNFSELYVYHSNLNPCVVAELSGFQ